MRRCGERVVIGEGRERWSLVDPGCLPLARAHHAAKYETARPLSDIERLLLASVVEDMHYLLYTCPTSKLACEKIQAIRRALREEPDDGE